MHCENCGTEIATAETPFGKTRNLWNFCPECGINLAPLNKLVKTRPGESDESAARAKKPSMRELVVDVIVRQALVSLDWVENCREPMEANDLCVADIKKELFARGYKTGEDGLPVKLSESELIALEADNLLAFKSKTQATGDENFTFSKSEMTLELSRILAGSREDLSAQENLRVIQESLSDLIARLRS